MFWDNDLPEGSTYTVPPIDEEVEGACVGDPAYYEDKICVLEQELANLVGEDQQLVDCQLGHGKRLRISRNGCQSCLEMVLQFQSQQQDSCRLDKSDSDVTPWQELATANPQQSKEGETALKYPVYFPVYGGIEQPIIEHQQVKILECQVQEYQQQVITLTTKLLQYQNQLQCESTQLDDIEHHKYSQMIELIESSLQECQEQCQDTNTLTIAKGAHSDTLVLQLQPSSGVNQDAGVLRYTTQRNIPQTQSIDLANKVSQLTQDLMLSKANHVFFVEQSNSQATILRNQIFTLLEEQQQLNNNNLDMKKLLVEYEVKLSNRRDFYKVKLADLQSRVELREKYLDSLEELITGTEAEYAQKLQGQSSINQAAVSYQVMIQQLAQRVQDKASEVVDLRKQLQSQRGLHSAEVCRLNRLYQQTLEEMRLEVKFTQQVVCQLAEQKQLTANLQATASESHSSLVLLREECRQLDLQCQRMRQSSQDDEDLEYMKQIIEELHREVAGLKEMLEEKEEESRVFKYNLQLREQEVQELEAQSRMQIEACQKLRRSSEVTDDYIFQLQQQLKQKGGQAHGTGCKEEIDLNTINNKKWIQELRDVNLKGNADREMVLRLIKIVNEYGIDLDYLEAENVHLKKVVREYEQIMQEQMDRIKFVQENQCRGDRVNNQRVNILRENQRLQREVGYLRATLGHSSQDLRVLEQVVGQLERERENGQSMAAKLQEFREESEQYQREISQKIDTIKHLKLALIKASSSVNCAPGWDCQQQQDLRETNKRLEQTLRRVVLSKGNEIEGLTYQLKILDHNVIPALKEQLDEYTITIHTLQASNRELLEEIGRRPKDSVYLNMGTRTRSVGKLPRNRKNLNLQQLKGGCSYLAVLHIMLCLCEQTENNQQSIHPEDVYLIGFDQQNPQSVKLRIAECGGDHENGDGVFVAPQLIRGKQHTMESAAWNYGAIFDFLVHKQPYFKNNKEALDNKNTYKVRSKVPSDVQVLLQGLLQRDMTKRLLVGMCRESLLKEISRVS